LFKDFEARCHHFLFIFEKSITNIQNNQTLMFQSVLYWFCYRMAAYWKKSLQNLKCLNCQIQGNIIIQPCAMFSLAQ
ncbi:MAG: hypothetical protein ACK559_04910, partial [bacterium]